MVRYTFAVIPTLMFFASVIMYLGDFRLVAIGCAIAGWASYFVGKELTSSE